MGHGKEGPQKEGKFQEEEVSIIIFNSYVIV